MSQSAGICGVCHRFRSRGNRNDAGDLFICAQCQADARQLIEIQDSIWGETGAMSDSPDQSDEPADP